MDGRLSNALITATTRAGVALTQIKSTDIYDTRRKLRAEIFRAAESAGFNLAQFGDESTSNPNRLAICPVDSESNLKHRHPGGFSVMVGYFEAQVPVFSVIYCPTIQVTINATHGLGTQINGTKVTAHSNGPLSKQLIGGIFDMLHTNGRHSDLSLVGRDLVEIMLKETDGLRLNGSIGMTLLDCLNGGLGGLIVPCLEPDQRAVLLPLIEAGLLATDLQGDSVSLGSSSLVAAGKSIHRDLLDLVNRSDD